MQAGVFIFIMCLMKEVGSHGEQLDSSDYKRMVETWRPQQGLVVHTPCPSVHPFPCKWKALSERSQRLPGRGSVSFLGFMASFRKRNSTLVCAVLEAKLRTTYVLVKTLPLSCISGWNLYGLHLEEEGDRETIRETVDCLFLANLPTFFLLKKNEIWQQTIYEASLFSTLTLRSCLEVLAEKRGALYLCLSPQHRCLW